MKDLDKLESEAGMKRYRGVLDADDSCNVFDRESDEWLDGEDVAELLNDKDKRIEELEGVIAGRATDVDAACDWAAQAHDGDLCMTLYESIYAAERIDVKKSRHIAELEAQLANAAAGPWEFEKEAPKDAWIHAAFWRADGHDGYHIRTVKWDRVQHGWEQLDSYIRFCCRPECWAAINPPKKP